MVVKMFLDKYLNDVYLELLYSNYDEDYINSLDQDNFNKVYILLKEKKFYYIEDIILNYLEIFFIDEKYIRQALDDMEFILGDDYVKVISNKMTLINKIFDIATDYSVE